jgi:tetratricopeptide (TPR) repeat protein
MATSQDNGIRIESILKKRAGYKEDVKALIIGVSDYQNIKSLKYAHRDAQEFSVFAQNNPFWNVSPDNTLLLTNESAKQGDILTGLQWLMETTEDNGEVVFYFSGHGDVESVTEGTEGFLLAYDAPKCNYALGGTIPVAILDSVFTNFTQRNVKITLIIDACKSGQLAGGMLGINKTNEELGKRWKTQIRILSSQPDQISLEDEKWGGGRGVFSYYLIKGLSGFADSDGNGVVLIDEIDSYMGRNVSIQTSGTQEPIIEAPNKYSTNLAVKDSIQMAAYEKYNDQGEISFLLAGSKTGEDLVNEDCSTTYNDFTLILNTLKSDNLELISQRYWQLQACEKGYANLRYEFTRILINEINRITQMSVTGKDLMGEKDFQYGIELLELLFKVNEGKNLLGKIHFENLYTHLKTHHFVVSKGSKLQFTQFTLEADSCLLEPKELIQTIEKFGFRNEDAFEFKDMIFNNSNAYVWQLKLDDNNGLSLQWYSNLENSFSLVQNIQDQLIGPLSLKMMVYNDSILVGERKTRGKKFKKLIDHTKSIDYLEKLSEELIEAANKEPHATYLAYSLALTYMKAGDYAKIPQLLDSAIVKTPKWLMLQNLLGAAYSSQKQYDKAIVCYENILELETEYQDFDCLDCFFFGLIQTYIKAKRFSKVDDAILQWKKIDGEDALVDFDYYDLLLDDGILDKDYSSFILQKMWNTSSYSFTDQIQLLIREIQTDGKKYKPDDIFSFIQNLIRLGSEGELLNYLNDTLNRDTYFKSEIAQRFFPNGIRIKFHGDYTRDNSWLYVIQSDLFNEKLSLLLDVLLFNESPIIPREYILTKLSLESKIKYNSLSDFMSWLETLIEFDHSFSFRKRRTEYLNRYPTKTIFELGSNAPRVELLTKFEATEDMFYEFNGFAFMKDHIDFMYEWILYGVGHEIMLLAGIDVTGGYDFVNLVSNASSYEQRDTLTDIYRYLEYFLGPVEEPEINEGNIQNAIISKFIWLSELAGSSTYYFKKWLEFAIVLEKELNLREQIITYSKDQNVSIDQAFDYVFEKYFSQVSEASIEIYNMYLSEDVYPSLEILLTKKDFTSIPLIEDFKSWEVDEENLKYLEESISILEFFKH